MLGILEYLQNDEIELVSSTILELEIARNPLAVRREHGEQVLLRAKETIFVTDVMEERAQELIQYGLAAMDALHLAAAESGKADYFCTCDDFILRKSSDLTSLRTMVVSPLELIEVLEI